MQTIQISRPIAAWLLALGLLLAGVPALATTYYVANSGNDTNAGTDPAFPKLTIQAAINVTVSGDSVIVADATYTGVGNKDLDFFGRNITLRSASGDPTLSVIDCERAGRGFTFHSGETSEAIVEGFTIRNGNVSDYGGGIYISGSSPTLTNCTFTGNTATIGGGGIRVEAYSSPTLTNCTFSGNTAKFDGGMGVEYNSNPTLTNCTFSGNTAYNSGGGMSVWYSNATLTNCTFTGNRSGNGGGMYVEGSNPTLTNCTFTGNSAPSGGGMYVEGYSPTYSSPTLTNCILWGDIPGELLVDGSTTWPYSTIYASHSAIQGGWDGTGNIACDPRFLNAATGDLRLQPTSPCINTGDNRVVTSPPFLPNEDGILLDLDGNPRIQYGIVDMGAYEVQNIATSTVSGTVTLEQMSASAPPPTLTFTFRPVDNCGDFELIVTLGENGTFTLTDIARKEYIVHIKGMKWLAQNKAVNTTNGDVTGIQATLKAADANNDNVVDVLDLDVLIVAFDSKVGDPYWNEGADLNCDWAVNVLDLELLILNFDQVGDF